MSIHLTTSVRDLPGIGAGAAKDLAKLDITCVHDLLWHVPNRYDDFSRTMPIPQLRHDDSVTLVGVIESIASRPSKNSRLTLTEALFVNESGSLKVVWFNQPYLEQTIRPGTRVALAGRINRRFGEATLMNPVHEPPGVHINTGRLVPVYGLSGSLTQRRLRRAISCSLPALRELADWVPDGLREVYDLPPLEKVLQAIHFPESREELQHAVDRLKFDELFLHQLLFADVRRQRVECRAHPTLLVVELMKSFVEHLPFKITNAQRIAAWEILQDLTLPQPMNRLLQGDVGSGKTVVAAMAILSTMHAGKQAAYLAPTEILAEQQYRALCHFLKGQVSQTALFTRSKQLVNGEEVKKEDVIARLGDGSIQLAVGTHALLQEAVTIPDLALVVIDEQHRFGVEQRRALLNQTALAPHLLSMTATPIPRSLALTLYGDLDVSILNELPAGRKPIDTRLILPGREEEVYTALKTEIKNGRQGFVVCPLIDPSDQLGSQSVTNTAAKLKRGALKGCRLGLLHGQLKRAEKEQVMQAFVNREVDVLVSTTVVEVGVDVPNATVIAILGAERFGLSQLHQLRGRVGRSDIASKCFLCPDQLSPESQQRLTALLDCQDGFALAERDLQFRGAGNIFGSAQSGFPDFRFATFADADLMKKTRDAARSLMDADPDLSHHPLVREKMALRMEEVHLE